jgi:hypothetical protein
MANNECETLLIVNQTCSQSDACNTGLGLSCQTNVCKCSSAKFWKSSSIGCINFYDYSQGTCQDDNQCQNNLICRTSASIQACNCYTSGTQTSVGDCDCPAPVYGSEYYYNGSYCVPAKSLNASCGSNLQCQQITEKLFCISGICTCGANYLWNGTECITCMSGWTYHRASCFRVSSATSNIIYYISTSTLRNGCYGETSSRLAILYNSDATSSSFTNSFANDYWFDAFRAAGSTEFYSSFSTGYSISASGTPNQYYWDLMGSTAEQCARFVTGSTSWTGFSYGFVTKQFKSRNCQDNKHWICEYEL